MPLIVGLSSLAATADNRATVKVKMNMSTGSGPTAINPPPRILEEITTFPFPPFSIKYYLSVAVSEDGLKASMAVSEDGLTASMVEFDEKSVPY